MPRPATSRSKEDGSARAILAENMVRLRAAVGLSQEALAFEAGLHRTFIAHVERRARNVSIDNVEKIAIALGVPVYELLMPSQPASTA
jgi:transcriptional regulator with XRE-family HTH domain